MHRSTTRTTIGLALSWMRATKVGGAPMMPYVAVHEPEFVKTSKASFAQIVA